MRLLTIPQPGLLKAEEVETPHAATGEVRIRVESVGICGSDIEIFEGRRQPKTRHGHPVLGHEVAGTVDQIGEGVTGLQIGDRLSCIEGWGALADFVITKPLNSLTFDNRIEIADGCLLEVLPGVAMASWSTGIDRSSDVLVVGQGLSGLLITRLVALQGCRRIVTVDPIADRCAISREFGADDSRPKLIEEAAAELSRDYPSGFDIAIVATPTNTINHITSLMRPRSRIVAYGGLDHDAEIDIMTMHHRSISVIKEGEGINGIREARAIWKEALGLIYDGLLPISRLRTHQFPMNEAQAAFELRAAGGGLHIVMLADDADSLEAR